MLTRPDRKQELRDQRFHFGRRDKAKQELPCNVRGESGVNAVEMLAFGLRKNGMEPKQGSEIIECHSGKYLLLDERALFGMKVCQRKRIFQIPERSLNAPAFVVKLTE